MFPMQQLTRETAVFKLADSRWMRSVQFMVTLAQQLTRDCSVRTCWPLMNMLNSVDGDTQQLTRETAVFKLVDSRWMRSVQLTVTLMQQLTRETAVFELVDSWWMHSVQFTVTLKQQLTRETAVIELVDIDGCLEFSSHGDTSTGNRNK